MMKKTRILSAILAMLMLVGPLASCATGDGDGETQGPQQTVANDEADTDIKDELPSDLNYGGQEITIISRDMEGWTRGEVSVEGLNSDPVNDSVYERNKMVETRLNIKINSILDKDTDSSAVPNKVATAVKAGTGEYDLMAAAAYTTASESLNGTFANLRNTEYIDFEKPWWTQGYNEAMTYEDMQFTVTGSLLLSIYRFAFVTIFNKNLFTEANQPFLYDTVEKGEWTLDKQISLVPVFHRDNGNGQQDAEGDIYGFVSSSLIGTDPYWSSCDIDILRVNGDGELEMVFDVNKLYEATEKILKLYYGTDSASYVLSAYGTDSEQEDIRNMFSQGLAAMATLRIMELENSSMRNMTDEYGVIPMPKFDTVQQDYRTLLHDQFTVYAVPTTVTGDKLDMVSAVLEAMGSASWKIVKPAYYETTLRTKIAQDPQSAMMMDIITQGIYIDAGIVYTSAFNSFHAGLRTMVGEKQNNAISRYKAITKGAEAKLRGMTKKLDKLASEQ